MPEIPYPQHMREGISVPHGHILRYLAELIAIIEAQRACREDDFIEVLDEFFEDEIQIRLVALASKIRTFLNVDPQYEAAVSGFCGSLLDVSTGGEEDLSVREACNKILHAERIRFDGELVDPLDRNSGYALNPVLHFYGSHRGSDWKATLHLHRLLSSVRPALDLL